jgi:hypothetical protein
MVLRYNTAEKNDTAMMFHYHKVDLQTGSTTKEEHTKKHTTFEFVFVQLLIHYAHYSIQFNTVSITKEKLSSFQTYSFLSVTLKSYSPFNHNSFKLCRYMSKMESANKIVQITLGQQNCKVIGRLTRTWDSINMRSKSSDSLISIDGIIVDEDVSKIIIQL